MTENDGDYYLLLREPGRKLLAVEGTGADRGVFWHRADVEDTAALFSIVHPQYECHILCVGSNDYLRVSSPATSVARECHKGTGRRPARSEPSSTTGVRHLVVQGARRPDRTHASGDASPPTPGSRAPSDAPAQSDSEVRIGSERRHKQ